MDALLENVQRIFDVARSAQPSRDPGSHEGEYADIQDFALLVRPDGALHFIMESPFSIEAAAIHAGAHSAFRITHSREGVRVEGRNASNTYVLEERGTQRDLIRDQPLYRITSPLLTACPATS